MTGERADSPVTAAVQWAPSGNTLDGRPGEILRLLASPDGTTHGYGGGPGASMAFGTRAGGDIHVLPGQWVTVREDGSVTVDATDPTIHREPADA